MTPLSKQGRWDVIRAHYDFCSFASLQKIRRQRQTLVGSSWRCNGQAGVEVLLLVFATAVSFGTSSGLGSMLRERGGGENEEQMIR